LRFFRIVRAGFSQARKKLRNSLAAGLHLRPDEVSTWMLRADLDPSRRAETLSIADWLALVHEAPESS
jgi:16S rRNA (adenine1518-N6/adenine1519-N6)-dimethyltransferase